MSDKNNKDWSINEKYFKEEKNMNLELTKEQAREIYSVTKDDGVKKMLEANYSLEDLGVAPIKPKSWGDLGSIKGCWINNVSYIQEQCEKASSNDWNRNIFKTREQAEASIALAQLSQLMAHPYYNGDWIPDWSGEDKKFNIIYRADRLCVSWDIVNKRFLVFKTIEKAEEFLEDHKELITQAIPLL